MSRIGKKPVTLPKGVEVKIGERIEVKGPKGALSVPIPNGISVKNNGGVIELTRENDKLAALHGLTRALAQNAVTGVSTGFTRELDIVGIGYRAELKGRQVTFALGYSHPIVFDIPTGIDVAVDKQTHITVTGVDRQLVGQVAANIRGMRKPDPYKQKGVRYTGEVLKKKVGKTGAK